MCTSSTDCMPRFTGAVTRGAVLGLANRSFNALGDGGLTEAALLLPCGHTDMARFLSNLRHGALSCRDARFSEAMDAFRLADMQARQRLGTDAQSSARTPIRLRTFLEWPAMPNWEPWHLSWWTENGQPPEDTTQACAVQTGSLHIANWRSATSGNALHPYVATIDCRLRGGRCGGVRRRPMPFCWYPGSALRTEQASWHKDPFHWYATFRCRVGEVPFDINDARF
jgi:hypothetical protein